jgi:hydrogenase maturation protein HypF
VGSARAQLRITGTVQGVGYRPFVYRHAVELGLSGYVLNDSSGVLVDVEGPPDSVAELTRRLAAGAPPLARVESITTTTLPASGTAGRFQIVESSSNNQAAVPVSVDTATCDDCLREMNDPTDRRFGYPFINCTNCGPRYTIVRSVPYDRPATTMAAFTMCPACQGEYEDPSDRRFHAQPNACADCGPRLELIGAAGSRQAVAGKALDLAVGRLLAGEVLAIKGLGGYHLAVDATNETAVGTLRQRKARDERPFALMATLPQAHSLCELDDAAVAALTSYRRPIVLASKRRSAGGGAGALEATDLGGGALATGVAAGVAPSLPELGIMLAYTPLHHLLLARTGRPLVMTSGNLADDPIAYDDADARRRLGPLVDGILTHERQIHIRCDDSVVRSSAAGVQMVRRSRGFSPEPMALPSPARRQVLAVGAQSKNTVSVAKAGFVATSHHIGDLEHLAAYRSFVEATHHLTHLYGIEPDVIAHDLHPEYLSTKHALDTGLPSVAIQHHHAHVASCLLEHGHTRPVLGVAFDGLGYGPDETLWGGEWLLTDLTGYQRVGHLRTARLPGGAAAIREPWRMAVAWVHEAAGHDAAARLGLDERSPAVLALVERGRALRTSSMGRLFDAVAALLGIRLSVSYEGQAAIELEALARQVPAGVAAPYPIELHWDEMPVLDPAPLLDDLLRDLQRGVDRAQIAAAFHEGIGAGAAEMTERLAGRHDMDTVALSGGVFQNARLTDILTSRLSTAGLRVLTHRHLPANDGGISAGQAAIAATMPDAHAL